MVEENRLVIPARYPHPGRPVILHNKTARNSDRFGAVRTSRLISVLMLGFIVATILALGACSSNVVLTEDQQYARADALILARESFQSLQRACSASGGVISVNRTVTRIKREPGFSEYKLARCVRL